MLVFQMNIGRQKPESIVNRETICPFCDRSLLADVLEEDGTILHVMNKYPVLQDTLQTVLIETDECDGELSLYTKEHLYRLIRFGVRKWREMEASGQFRSVVFLKNHGHYSGGTLRHPHMQLIGLKDIDYRAHVEREQFEGLLIDEQPGVTFNLSTKPRMGFFEWNVLLQEEEQIDRMADYIQMAAHFVLTHFHRSCTSYNLFFYQLPETGTQIYAKIVPRFPTTSLFVGYSIPQVASNLEDVVARMREIYFA